MKGKGIEDRNKGRECLHVLKSQVASKHFLLQLESIHTNLLSFPFFCFSFLSKKEATSQLPLKSDKSKSVALVFLFSVITLSPSNQSFFLFGIWFLVFMRMRTVTVTLIQVGDLVTRDTLAAMGVIVEFTLWFNTCLVFRTNGNFLGCRIHTFFSRFSKSQNPRAFLGGFTASNVSFPSIYLFTYFL